MVPELLKPTGLTNEMRNNYKCMKQIADVTQIDPIARFKLQLELAQKLNAATDKNEMGLFIDQESN